MAFFDGIQGTQDLQRVQDLLERAFNKVEDAALLSTNVVANVTLKSGFDNPVFHGLGRPIRGWLIVRNNAVAPSFWEGTTPTDPTKFVNLRTNVAGATVSILFF